jgi:hypothetical protein
LPLDPSNLVGIWCTGGGWSLYTLIFRPDGVARADFSNLHLTNSLTFKWWLSRDDLHVQGVERVALNGAQDDVVREPWSVSLTIPISVHSVRLEDGQADRVLRLERAVVDWFPLEYVAGNPAYDVYAAPDFGWLHRRRGD